MICILMGVSGSGKSTIGQLLSQRWNCQFYDADDFHPEANISKMRQGIPLDDRDRLPWLVAIRRQITELLARQENAVFACSALKKSYRELLQGNSESIVWIYLQGTYEQIFHRMAARGEHFMKPEMLQGQLATLEVPEDALAVDIGLTEAEIVAEIDLYVADLVSAKLR